jgi:hypothetical protein
MLDTIIVFGIVIIVIVMAGKSVYRTFLLSGTGKNTGCGCACNCQGCAGKNYVDTHIVRDEDK